MWSEPKFALWEVCWFDVRTICMVPGDWDGYCPMHCCWWRWLFIQIYYLFWERKILWKHFVVMTKPELILINICTQFDDFNLKNKPRNAKFENDLWKITGVRALTGLDGPADRPTDRPTPCLLEWQPYPCALEGCRVIKLFVCLLKFHWSLFQI